MVTKLRAVLQRYSTVARAAVASPATCGMVLTATGKGGSSISRIVSVIGVPGVSFTISAAGMAVFVGVGVDVAMEAANAGTPKVVAVGGADGWVLALEAAD